jgi:hypothetical protein
MRPTGDFGNIDEREICLTFSTCLKLCKEEQLEDQLAEWLADWHFTHLKDGR